MVDFSELSSKLATQATHKPSNQGGFTKYQEYSLKSIGSSVRVTL